VLDISFRLAFCCPGKVFLIEKRIERLKDQGLVFFFFGLGIGVGLNFHDSWFLSHNFEPPSTRMIAPVIQRALSDAARSASFVAIASA
jgi:hypothetical protein